MMKISEAVKATVRAMNAIGPDIAKDVEKVIEDLSNLD